MIGEREAESRESFIKNLALRYYSLLETTWLLYFASLISPDISKISLNAVTRNFGVLVKCQARLNPSTLSRI